MIVPTLVHTCGYCTVATIAAEITTSTADTVSSDAAIQLLVLGGASGTTAFKVMAVQRVTAASSHMI
jgi:hypothetical protein